MLLDFMYYPSPNVVKLIARAKGAIRSHEDLLPLLTAKSIKGFAVNNRLPSVVTYPTEGSWEPFYARFNNVDLRNIQREVSTHYQPLAETRCLNVVSMNQEHAAEIKAAILASIFAGETNGEDWIFNITSEKVRVGPLKKALCDPQKISVLYPILFKAFNLLCIRSNIYFADRGAQNRGQYVFLSEEALESMEFSVNGRSLNRPARGDSQQE